METTQVKHAEQIRVETALMNFMQAPRQSVRKRLAGIAEAYKQQQQVAVITQGVKDFSVKVEVQQLKLHPVEKPSTLGVGGVPNPTGALSRHTFVMNNNGVPEYWSLVAEYLGVV